MFQFVLVLESSLLGADQAQNDASVFGNMTQGFKAARPLVVVFQKKPLKPGFLKNLDNGCVVARCVELALVVTAAQVQTKSYAGMIADHGIVHLDREVEQSIRIVAPLPVSLTQLWIQ